MSDFATKLDTLKAEAIDFVGPRRERITALLSQADTIMQELRDAGLSPWVSWPTGRNSKLSDARIIINLEIKI